MLHYYTASFSLLSLAVVVHSSPVSGPSPSRGMGFKVATRSNGLVAREQAVPGNFSLFNADAATKDFKTVIIKYSKATQFLAGIGVHPATHPEAGYPQFDPTGSVISSFVDTRIPPPNLTSGAHVRAAGPSGQDAPGAIGMPPALGSGTQSEHMPLTDYMSEDFDILYYGRMNLGKPSQSLTFDIDTGSADLWAPVNCNNCLNDQFDGLSSSTYRATTAKCSVTYGIGKVSGVMAQDVVSLGSLSVPNQTFCAVRKESSEINSEPNSGLLGLAFSTISQSGKPTFFENLLAQKKLAESIFSVYMTRRQETGSEVCFGCYDATKSIDKLTWNPLVSRTYWSIAMDGVRVNSTHILHANLTAAIDTGTSLIYLPDAVAAKFYSLIPGSALATEYGPGFYHFPCATSLSVALSMNGTTYEIHPADFNIGAMQAGSNQCIGGIVALDNDFPDNLAIVGAEFMKSWYTVFDYSGRVGFARSINNDLYH